MSKANKQQVPKIRFEGFSEDWSSEKLKDITSLITKGTTPLDKSWSGTVNYIKTDSIDPSSGTLLMRERTSLEEHNGHLKRSQLRNDDILFSIVGTLGRVGLVKEINLPANTNQQIAIIRLKNQDAKFIFNSLKTEAIESFINSDSTIGAQPSLSLWQINDILLKIPRLEEQNQIGNFFQQLDKLIELQTRAVESAETYKKAMLQKMFPQKGEKVPRVRFEGFSGDWEERKVGDIFTATRGQVLAATKVSPIKVDSYQYPVYSSQTKDNGLLGYYDSFLFENAITWTTDGAHAGTVNYRKEKFYSTNVNGVLLSDAGFANPTISEILNFVAFKYVSRVGNPKLMNNIMVDIPIVIPPLLEEQIIIGNYIQKLDQNIESEKKKLEQYQTMKRAILQRMFV